MFLRFSFFFWKMKSFYILLLFVPLYNAHSKFVCQFYDIKFKYLEEFCEIVDESVGCLRQIQTIESDQVGQLKLEGCNSNVITEEINRFIFISYMNIKYSKHWSLDYLNTHLDRLKILNVSHNHLEKVPKDIFCQTPEIVEIDLSHNDLSHLEWGAFDRANKLARIHLSHNQLRDIQPDTIMNLIHLEMIDLSFNRLQNIPEFSSNQKLVSIHLEGNPTSTYDCFHLTRMSTVALHFLWQDISYFYGNWHCHGKQMLIVRNTEFEGIFTRSTDKYELACSVQSFKHLRQFVAGHKTFANVEEILHCFTSSIESIDLSGNVIEALNSTIFNRFIQLKELMLSNCQLRTIDLSIFKAPNKFNSLDISFNNLQNIENVQLFASFINLYELKVAGNQFVNATQIIRHLKSSVEYLDLSKNSIGILNSNIFHHLTALKVLNLSDTRLSITDYNPFASALTLRSLDISYNNLDQVNLLVLSTTLNRLEYFYAAHCHIENILNVIQSFSLSLIELNLSGNFIKLLTDSMLQHLSSAHILDFSYNHLHEIDVGRLSSKLERINLEGNELRTIEKLSRFHFVSLKSLAISNNFLPCKYLKDVMREWEGIQFIGDSFAQKHKQDCHLIEHKDRNLFTSIFIIKSNSGRSVIL